MLVIAYILHKLCNIMRATCSWHSSSANGMLILHSLHLHNGLSVSDNSFTKSLSVFSSMSHISIVKVGSRLRELLQTWQPKRNCFAQICVQLQNFSSERLPNIAKACGRCIKRTNMTLYLIVVVLNMGCTRLVLCVSNFTSYSYALCDIHRIRYQHVGNQCGHAQISIASDRHVDWR
jgi:hypothetical protein